MTFELSINGTDEINKTLKDMISEKTQESAMNRSVLLVVNRMAKYPPAIPGSTYIRGQGKSERLGQSWTYRLSRISKGLQGKVGNNASYGPWVQSEQFQARVHKGRWQTDEQVIGQEENRIRSFFEDAIIEVIR